MLFSKTQREAQYSDKYTQEQPLRNSSRMVQHEVHFLSLRSYNVICAARPLDKQIKNYFSYLLHETYVVDTQKNHLNETIAKKIFTVLLLLYTKFLFIWS